MKVSIITVTLNEEQHIRRNITSVRSQTYKNIEHIFIDGYSTDNTPKIIEEYGNKIEKLYPKGIYNVMNHGATISTGDYVLFLNGNDWLVNEHVIEEVINFISEYPGFDLYFGRKQNFDCNLKRTNSPLPYRKKCPKLSKLGNFVSHPSSFFSKRYVENNSYREDLLIVSDRYYITDCFLNWKVKDMKILTTNYFRCGLSYTDKKHHLRKPENISINMLMGGVKK